MDIVEKNVSIIEKIAKNFEIEKTKQKYNENIALFDEVKKFIIDKKLILYGGYAINLLLSDTDKFYEDFTLNDYDCYSVNAKNDAIELVKILTDKGYKYIQLKTALHEDTFKVYADFEQILDITQVDKIFFDNLSKLSSKERRTDIYKYFPKKEKGITISPVLLLKRNLYFELARPYASIHRWYKLYPRLMKLNNNPIFEKKTIEIKHDLPLKINENVDKLLKYIQKNKYIIVGNFAYSIHNKDKLMKYNNNIESYLSILSSTYEKTANEIKLLLDNIIDKELYYLKVVDFDSKFGLMNNSKKIVIVDIATKKHYNIIDVQDSGEECFSFKTIDGYTIGTIHVLLYIYYSSYTTLFSSDGYRSNIENINYIQSHIINLESILKLNKDIRKIISVDCKGNITNIKEIKKNLWGAKRTIIQRKND